MPNPFVEVTTGSIAPAPSVLVIFGATGDLTARKLLPALFNLEMDGYLPDTFAVIGASRTEHDDSGFRAIAKEAVQQFSRRGLQEELWERFEKKLFYQPLDGTSAEDFQLLVTKIKDFEKQTKQQCNYLYYLATAPRFFGPISKNLQQAGLVDSPGTGTRHTSVVVEKPFGHNVESSRELNRTLRENFDEKQIYRIDHYLGKETVQNLLIFRFGNSIFEPLWNRKYIDHIQISVCESIGVGSRAGYFDKTGIMRDIVQNHLLQMLSLLCIEPPVSLTDADSIRDEKVKVLRSLRPIHEQDVVRHVVRGQYDRGYINGKSAESYTEAEGIQSNSETETFVAMRCEVDNWRWAGVPIYIRAGKRLPKRITELAIYFNEPPRSLFKNQGEQNVTQNVLAFQVQPDEGISLSMTSKAPGPHMQMRPVEMDFSYGSSFGIASPDAYERLLLDAMKSDRTLFTRDDEIECAWNYLAPVFSAWEGSNTPLHQYEAGTWGPAQAAELLRSTGHRWRRL